MPNSTIIHSLVRLALMVILPLITAPVVSIQVAKAQEKLKLPLGLQGEAAFIPDDNPLTPEKIALGKKFFWDKRWSASGTVACVSCHRQTTAGAIRGSSLSPSPASRRRATPQPSLTASSAIGSCGLASGPRSRSKR